MYRAVESSRVTYLADITRLSTKSPDYVDLIDLYETGSERGGCVLRCDPKTFRPRKYCTYGPKVIATRSSLPFEAKSIVIISEKTRDPIYTERRKELERPECEPLFEEAVKRIIRSVLITWRKVFEAYGELEQTHKLKGRRFLYWAPILAVCKVYAPEEFSNLLDLAEEDALRCSPSDFLSEVENAVLVWCVEEAPSSDTCTVLLKDLVDYVRKRVGVELVKSYHPVKSACRNLGIVKKEMDRAEGKVYQLNVKKAREKAKERGIAKEGESDYEGTSLNGFSE